jgi:hypothetical protein
MQDLKRVRWLSLASIGALVALSVVDPLIFGQVRAEPAIDKTVTDANDPTQVRVRELIYILRQHRVFERTDEWGSAIQELTKIGKPALPELLLELRETKREATLRGVLFTIRAIDDPRAIPFLVEVLPKAEQLSNVGRSDCGVYFLDPKLRRFMRQNQNRPEEDEDGTIIYGRPINEIIGTLSKLSRPDHQNLKNEEIWKSKYWREWWKTKEQSGAALPKEKSLVLTSRKEDLVERDGVRKFGPLFPTGPSQFLGPVVKVRLANRQIADAASLLDFESGRLFEYHEGRNYGPDEKDHPGDELKWTKRNGIDIDSYGVHDVHLWLIDNSRWDTLDSEVRSNNRFDIGKEVPLLLFGTNPEVNTFLFTTREGSRGVLREFRKLSNGRTRLEYRLWNHRDSIVPVGRTWPPGKKDEWQPAKVALLKEPGFGNRCVYNLSKGAGEHLRASIFAPNAPPDINELLSKHGTIFGDDKIAAWARSNGVDVAAMRSRVRSEGQLNDSERVIGGLNLIDARVTSVSSEAFEHLTLAHAREILAREADYSGVAYVEPTLGPLGPVSFVFKTKAGLIGLIAILNVREKQEWIGFQYKLANTSRNADEDNR